MVVHFQAASAAKRAMSCSWWLQLAIASRANPKAQIWIQNVKFLFNKVAV